MVECLYLLDILILYLLCYLLIWHVIDPIVQVSLQEVAMALHGMLLDLCHQLFAAILYQCVNLRLQVPLSQSDLMVPSRALNDKALHLLSVAGHACLHEGVKDLGQFVGDVIEAFLLELADLSSELFVGARADQFLLRVKAKEQVLHQHFHELFLDLLKDILVVLLGRL